MPFWAVWKNVDAESAIALLGYLRSDCGRHSQGSCFPSKIGHSNEKPTMQNSQTIEWQRILLLTTVGFVAVMVIGTIHYEWRKRDGWCMRFYPDGKQLILYGADCQKPES
jgi:hypothetical protein